MRRKPSFYCFEYFSTSVHTDAINRHTQAIGRKISPIIEKGMLRRRGGGNSCILFVIAAVMFERWDRGRGRRRKKFVRSFDYNWVWENKSLHCVGIELRLKHGLIVCGQLYLINAQWKCVCVCFRAIFIRIFFGLLPSLWNIANNLAHICNIVDLMPETLNETVELGLWQNHLRSRV